MLKVKKSKKIELAKERVPIKPDTHRRLKVYAANLRLTQDEAILDLLDKVEKTGKVGQK